MWNVLGSNSDSDSYRLYKAFKDPECLYIVTEACLGGNLHNLLKEK